MPTWINYQVRVINDMKGIDININRLVTQEMMINDNDEYRCRHILITK